MIKTYYEDDANINYLEGKKIAVIGYGSQGNAHALNLKDSGLNVCVGLRSNSSSIKNAIKDGLEVKTTSEASAWADVIMMLVPDQIQKKVFENEIKPHLSEGNTLAFAHGFNIHFNQIIPEKKH